jgi:peptidoglycan hydrolase-like protein with peptidoglycan-binding domain
MAWRLAKSLSVLRTEIIARHPGTTVWTIGDQSHASGWSDHNPNSAGVVCAIDVKADGGLTLQAFVDHLVARPHRALKYVIYNRRIWSKTRASEGWRYYSGTNAHRDHAHVSVGTGSDGRSTGPYDDTSPWGIANIGQPSAPTTGLVPAAPLREGDSSSRVGHLQRSLNTALSLKLAVDDDYGPATVTAVKTLQRLARITIDGIYGDDSADALRDLLEANMAITNADVLKIWGYTNTALTKMDAYAILRDKGLEQQIRAEQSKQTVLLQQILAGQSELTEAEITAAVAEGVRQATPPVEELAAAVAAAVDHDLDPAAVTEALRAVLGSLDGAGE